MNRVGLAISVVVSAICTDGGLLPLRAAPVDFYSVLDSTPLEVKPQPNETETEAVKEFKSTGRNPYRGQETAQAEGKKLYESNCQVCHAPNATGGTGPSLVGDEYTYPRVTTDVGMLEVIYGGASGVMPSWSKRGMTQDQMLQIIAYVRSLKKP